MRLLGDTDTEEDFTEGNFVGDEDFPEIKDIDYSKLNIQLNKIEVLIKNFPSDSNLQERFQVLRRVFNIRDSTTYSKHHSLIQFEQTMLSYALAIFSPTVFGDMKEDPLSQSTATRLREFRMWSELKAAFQKFKKFLKVIPDLEDDTIRIYFWKPTTALATGHVALKTKEIYASFWPDKKPDIETGFSTQGVLQSYADDVAEEAKDRERDSGNEDAEIEISGLNVAEVNRRFGTFQEEVKKGNIKWSLLSHRWIEKYYPNTNRQNCSGLVAELLEAGEIKKLISGFRDRNDVISSTILRFVYTKELGPIMLAFPALYLRDKPGIANFIPALVCGIPLFSLFLCLNRFKRQHIIDPNLTIIGDLLAAIGTYAPLIGFSVWITKLGGDYLLEGNSFLSIVIICVLASINWYAFDKASAANDFIIRCCCPGTDVFIRPSGIYELVTYAKKMGRLTDRVKFKINMEFTSAYYLKSCAGLLGIAFGKMASHRFVMGVNQGGMIGLHLGILLCTMLDLCSRRAVRKLYSERFYSYDPMNKKHWPDTAASLDDYLYERDNEPDLELAENDYHYLREAFNDVLYFPSFSTTTVLGVSWAILIANYFTDDSLWYFPFILGSSGLLGFFAGAGGYQLAKKMINGCRDNKEEPSSEAKLPLLNVQTSDNPYSLLARRQEQGHERSQTIEIVEDRREYSKCFCMIL